MSRFQLFAMALLLMMNASSLEAHSIIPMPNSYTLGEGAFTVPSNPSISSAPELADISLNFKTLFYVSDERKLADNADEDHSTIKLRHNKLLELESYKLDISNSGILVEASSKAGAFYALQTLRQLIDSSKKDNAGDTNFITLPVLKIVDRPRFAWRGMHLDVARHFMPVEAVKRLIDTMSLYKFNRFHWHLTDDQGWRIEIKQYPKLTEIGSCRAQSRTSQVVILSNDDPTFDGKRHCGYYTQEQIADVVEYAAARQITVMPEIEFPGHSQAAIAAYPDLGNLGTPIKVREDWGISEHILKPDQKTIKFYKNVLAEVMKLFPSKYIHIGGDEVPPNQWENSKVAKQLMRDQNLENYSQVQAWMIGELSAFIEANNRIMIGWDEIFTDDLSPKAAVMAWRTEEFGFQAAIKGHDVVMAPFEYTYFDLYQGDSKNEPPAIYPSFTPLEKVYSFDPAPSELEAEVVNRILGAQGQLWSEHIPTSEHLEYMAFPRAIALSEVLWSSNKPGFENFKQRMSIHEERLEQFGVNYRPLGNDGLSIGSAIELQIYDGIFSTYFFMLRNDLLNYKGLILLISIMLAFLAILYRTFNKLRRSGSLNVEV